MKILKKIFVRTKKGITLPEIMASLAIISIMGAAGTQNVLKYLTEARINATIQEMQSMRDAIMEYQRENFGETVSTVTTLVTYDYLNQGITDAPDSSLKTNYKKDAWDEDYEFSWPTLTLRGYIASAGPDGILDADNGGVEESNDDIVIGLEKIVN